MKKGLSLFLSLIVVLSILTSMPVTVSAASQDAFDFVITTDETITLTYTASREFNFIISDLSVAKISGVSNSIISSGSYYRQSSNATISPIKPGQTTIKVVASNGDVLTTSSLLVVEGGHQFVLSETYKEANCKETGSELYKCKFCGEEKLVETAVKHSSSDWIVEKEPTCTESGFKHKKCTICGEVLETKTSDFTGHIPSDWIVDNATIYSNGKKYKECTTCGEVLETAKIPQLKCSKPKLSKIENTADGVKITWGKVSGADKYDVYRKTGSSGKYSKIGTTSKTYYTDKKASSGKKYYYYVKAVNEAGSSDASSSKSIYHLADTTLSTPKSTKSGISLKWKKVTGADGYMVYRKTGSGSYSKIATVKGNSKVTYTDKSAKKGKKYTYKIKAYKSKTYSAYSNTKSVTDKY